MSARPVEGLRIILLTLTCIDEEPKIGELNWLLQDHKASNN